MNLHQPPTELRTERLVLRRPRPEDAEAIFAYAGNPAVTRWMVWQTHRSIEDSRRHINNSLANYEIAEPRFYDFAIAGADAPESLIGTIGVGVRSLDHATAEYGYILHPDYWGRGYATEASREILRFAFVELGFNRIEAHCRVDNAASARVLEKCGLRHEGTERQSLFKEGRYHDVMVYSIVRADWDGITNPPRNAPEEPAATL